MDGTERRPLSDSQLDRQIESAVGIDPTPEFLARVRTRIAAEPEPSAWRLAVKPVAALGIVGLVLVLVVPRFNSDDPVIQRTDRITVKEMAPELEPVPAVVPARPMGQRSVNVARAESPQTLPLQLSTPLFSDEDRRVFMQLIGAVEEGRLPPVVEAVSADDQPAARQEMRIEPLMIDPLPLLARVRKEGEDQW